MIKQGLEPIPLGLLCGIPFGILLFFCLPLDNKEPGLETLWNAFEIALDCLWGLLLEFVLESLQSKTSVSVTPVTKTGATTVVTTVVRDDHEVRVGLFVWDRSHMPPRFFSDLYDGCASPHQAVPRVVQPLSKCSAVHPKAARSGWAWGWWGLAAPMSQTILPGKALKCSIVASL